MNDEAARHGRPDTNSTTASDDSNLSGERGVFDLRLHVTGDDKLDVWSRVTVFYVQLRPGHRSHTFDATMAPTKRKKPAA